PTSGSPTDPSRGSHGPYFQSQRAAIYRRHVQALLQTGAAYPHAGAVRFRMPREPILIDDLIVGQVRRKLTDREELDPDFVLVRSDGQPVFHLVNVVDDLEMGITHVIRGEDHLANTAKHIALFRALNAEPPRYAHIPLILNPDGSKMSKRDRGASLTTYLEEGYVPAAVVNYLCLLGWSPKDDRQVLALAEVIERFDLPQILRHNARFDHTKLLWLNSEYLRAMDPDRFHTLAVEALIRAGVQVARFDAAYVRAALATCKEKVKRLADLKDFGGFYFVDDVVLDSAARDELNPEVSERLAKLRTVLARLEQFDAATLEAVVKDLAAALGWKVGLLVHPTRLVCTGRPIGPSLYHLMEVLGRERVLRRIDRALGTES
ncbi:MAG: glutamate--tRNA ligase, partial [Verrucomicrobia bacterium]|nr:glutamate--tRNA ligase [Verrucomicrobiota bacterium]